MAIASIKDVQRALDSTPSKGVPRITIGAGETLSTEAAKSFMDAQEAYIYARLGYTPDVTNNLVKEIHAKLTAYHIWLHVVMLSHGDGEIPEYVQEWSKWAEGCLTDAKNGDLVIPHATADGSVPMRAFSSDVRQVVDEPVTMRINDWIKLKYFPIIPNSELVYTGENKSGDLLVRDIDYKINYQQNEVMAISGGSLSDLQQVYFTYQHFESKQIRKDPERVDYGNRGIVPNYTGLFGG